ncbi:thioredoxin domain-containing protein [Methanolobus sp. ZRKC3]|uniref:thioredoxin domain-containing protein n=1 Tax=Methanolobus sp. ZRKC3 TaxID=3125786 RepID=UPI003248C9C8
MQENSNELNPEKANKLIREKSPYLLQHAYNPVDWYPWSEEAFTKAKEENKPIFLSIGYSTCHWCHVMEKESFENLNVARLMNENFVSIKVDREERPDIDSTYMSVCQALTGRGGWPLSIIMTPDKKPFLATTYIPRESRPELTGMLDLVPLIGDMWKNKKEELISNAEEIIAAVSPGKQEKTGNEPGIEVLDRAFRQLKKNYDPQNAGFGTAPKFPTPHNLAFLLRYWKRSNDPDALEMVENTLQAMRKGGVYDHVGHGFHRYSTDQNWLVPHFEKMLYDQALLAITYTEAFQATDNPEYKKNTEEIFTYVLRDMRSEDGGFFSAEDADSEGEEGKFYLWTEEELQQALDKDEFELSRDIFNTQPEGNFHDEATRRKTGKNILHLKAAIQDIAEKHGKEPAILRDAMERIRDKLYRIRKERIHPLKDDKIMTDWNGLMIVALSKASRAFNAENYKDAAAQTADFILSTMKKADGSLYHRYCKGEVAFEAFLEDHAFLIWGLIELYQAGFETKYLKAAMELNQQLIEHFWDNEGGAFFHTRDDAEELIFRNKEIYDGAIPSGNSVAALNLLQLGRITADTELEKMAHILMSTFSKQVTGMPLGYTQLMLALDFVVGPSAEIVVVGKRDSPETKDTISCINNYFIPNKVLIFKSAEKEGDSELLFDYTRDMEMKGGKTTVHICQDYNCNLPLNDRKEIRELLDDLK